MAKALKKVVLVADGVGVSGQERITESYTLSLERKLEDDRQAFERIRELLGPLRPSEALLEAHRLAGEALGRVAQPESDSDEGPSPESFVPLPVVEVDG